MQICIKMPVFCKGLFTIIYWWSFDELSTNCSSVLFIAQTLFSPTLNVNKPSSFYRNVRGIIYHCDWTRHYLHSFLLQVLEHQRAGNIHRPSCMLCGDFISSLYLRTVFHVCALVLTFNIFHYIQKENIVLVNWP